MAQITKERVTADEFFKLPETTKLAELLDGEIIIHVTPKHIHQRIVALLHLLLAKLIPGGEVVLSPSAVRLDDENVPEPDLFWVAGPESRCKLSEADWWYGAPDLVVEVLSPSTAKHDKGYKFRLYEKHGLREYWIVDPLNRYVEVWVLRDSKFHHLGIYEPQDSFESPVLNNQKVDLQAVFVVAGSEE
jgi:Uma2 family endonuclease